MGNRLLFVILALALGGCDAASENSETRPVGLTAEPPSTPSPALRLPDLGEGEVLLALHGQAGFITGVPYPPPPNADPDRILAATLHHDGSQTDLGDVEDAKFLDDGSLVLINRAHDLVHVSGAAHKVLASRVYGPLSVVGTRVAYTTGPGMPDFRAAALDVATGQAWRAAEDLMPAWAPALSEDGTGLVFASGHTGTTSLVVAELGPELRVTGLHPIGLAPSGPNAPIWQASSLIYESEEGLKRLDMQTFQTTALNGALPVLAQSGQVVVHDEGLRELPREAK